jgi:hypothetical protein
MMKPTDPIGIIQTTVNLYATDPREAERAASYMASGPTDFVFEDLFGVVVSVPRHCLRAAYVTTMETAAKERAFWRKYDGRDDLGDMDTEEDEPWRG